MVGRTTPGKSQIAPYVREAMWANIIADKQGSSPEIEALATVPTLGKYIQ